MNGVLIGTAAALAVMVVFQALVIVSLIRRLAEESNWKGAFASRMIEIGFSQKVEMQADQDVMGQALQEAADAKEEVRTAREAQAAGGPGEAVDLDTALAAAEGKAPDA